eukprot:m.137074 g.137074  ORF g.137074 m.137074 type:complete len:582 (+) comp29903_c2_seq1:113-1858(+)
MSMSMSMSQPLLSSFSSGAATPTNTTTHTNANTASTNMLMTGKLDWALEQCSLTRQQLVETRNERREKEDEFELTIRSQAVRIDELERELQQKIVAITHLERLVDSTVNDNHTSSTELQRQLFKLQQDLDWERDHSRNVQRLFETNADSQLRAAAEKLETYKTTTAQTIENFHKVYQTKLHELQTCANDAAKIHSQQVDDITTRYETERAQLMSKHAAAVAQQTSESDAVVGELTHSKQADKTTMEADILRLQTLLEQERSHNTEAQAVIQSLHQKTHQLETAKTDVVKQAQQDLKTAQTNFEDQTHSKQTKHAEVEQTLNKEIETLKLEMEKQHEAFQDEIEKLRASHANALEDANKRSIDLRDDIAKRQAAAIADIDTLKTEHAAEINGVKQAAQHELAAVGAQRDVDVATLDDTLADVNAKLDAALQDVAQLTDEKDALDSTLAQTQEMLTLALKAEHAMLAREKSDRHPHHWPRGTPTSSSPSIQLFSSPRSSPRSRFSTSSFASAPTSPMIRTPQQQQQRQPQRQSQRQQQNQIPRSMSPQSATLRHRPLSGSAPAQPFGNMQRDSTSSLPRLSTP